MPTPSQWIAPLKVNRPTKPAREYADEVRRLTDAGLSRPAIAKRLDICVCSVRKALRASRPPQ